MSNSAKTIWSERQCILGFHLTFTKYTVTKDRLLVEHGFIFYSRQELPLYRIGTVTVNRTLFGRIIGTGTLVLKSTVKEKPEIVIRNVHHVDTLSSMLIDMIDRSRKRNLVHPTELLPEVY